MAHDDHYHIHSHATLPPPPASGAVPPGPPSNATVTLSVPQNTTAGPNVSMDFYSLERDLAQLRRDATTKGILSANDRVNIGTTNGANPKTMLSLVIGGNLWAGPGPVPKVLIVGCHHAREWISVELSYLIAEYLVEKYDPSPGVPANDAAAPGNAANQAQRIKHLVGNREIWFVPMLNAEGHDHTITTSRKWRTNRFIQTFPSALTISAPQFGGGTARSITFAAGDPPAIGVDVNRNYNTAHWGEETYRSSPHTSLNRTTSRDPRDGGDDASFLGQIYCGMSGSSEREVVALVGLMTGQQFKSVVSYHNFSEEILAPDATFHDAFTDSVGNGMRTLIGERGGSYTFDSASGLYPTTGDTLDFYIENVPGNRPGYTIELSPPNPPANSDHKFSGLPEGQIRTVFQQNLAAALALINCAGFTSAPTGTTVTVRLGLPPWVVTVIPNCWNRFRGWDPTI
jgi:hypothetical protein